MTPPETALDLFAPIASSYERWARLLSLGQDARWRDTMLEQIDVRAGSLVLDVAAGTGSISRSLRERGCVVVVLDQSEEMIAVAGPDMNKVIAGGERLPFPDSTFDAVTFGYLLRYVVDVEACLRELVRVVRPGGRVGMVEFGQPAGVWYLLWWFYTRGWLPLAGRLIGSGWHDVARFLGPSIEEFARNNPPSRLAEVWRSVGMEAVRCRRLSLGGGLVMWGRVE